MDNPFKIEKIDTNEFALFMLGNDGQWRSLKLIEATYGPHAANLFADWIADLVRTAPLT